MLDLLIEAATIVDGTGNAPFRGSLIVRDDRVYIHRGDPGFVQARRRIAASSLCVAPGFIDLHSHSGLVLLRHPEHEPKVRQGVTTELIGVDGISYAPFESRSDLVDFLRMYAGLDGRPPSKLRWRSVAEYLSVLDGGTAVNIAFLVGSAALRVNAVGWSDVPADDRAMGAMEAQLREAMEEGAFGLSSGLDYSPGGYASTEELAALASQASRLGGFYHTHVRNRLGDGFLDPFREAIEIGSRGDTPVHLTHLYRRRGAPGGAHRILELVEVARQSGLDVTFDSYPYEWSSSTLLRLLPSWMQEGGPGQLKDRLGDSTLRRRLRRDLDRSLLPLGGEEAWNNIRVGNLSSRTYRRFDGCTVAEIALANHADPVDTVCDMLLNEDLGVNQVSPSVDASTLPRFIDHPLGMIASDSVFLGKRPSPRTYGTFPVVLEMVREERRMPIQEAVRKMTSFPAQRLGLVDRGLLRDGMKADIVVFDADRIKAPATYANPKQFAVGIEMVIVNGEIVVEGDELTPNRPGRVLRRARYDS